jgi:hypothetical protein
MPPRWLNLTTSGSARSFAGSCLCTPRSWAEKVRAPPPFSACSGDALPPAGRLWRGQQHRTICRRAA